MDLCLGQERSENVEMVSSFYALDPRMGNAYQKLKVRVGWLISTEENYSFFFMIPYTGCLILGEKTQVASMGEDFALFLSLFEIV